MKLPRGGLSRLVLSITLLAAASSCTGQIEGISQGLSQTPLDASFESAAVEFDVPVALLKAISYVETSWDMVIGDQEHEDVPLAFGVMGLRGERLERGAVLAGVSVDDARYDVLANIRAGAALLSAYADDLGVARGELGSWAVAAAEYSGIADDQGRAYYVHADVYAVMRTGARSVLEDGRVLVELEAVEVIADYDLPDQFAVGGGDYAEANYRQSASYNSRPSGANGTVGIVVIHTCEGAYSGCWSWLAGSNGVSAHYVVKENGAEVTQLVRENKRAWHIAATYDCSRNNGVDCWRNGRSTNDFSIGIEHAGFASQTTWSTAQLDASARLVCDITERNGIPRDANHIVGHGRLQPWNRTDPGPNWPWAHYIQRVRELCGDDGNQPPPNDPPTPPDDPPTPPDDPPTPPGDGDTTQIIIDSNNSRNDPARARIEVSASWTASNNVAGYYQTGYWWASTASISDGASFWFYLNAATTKTVSAWWPAASDRSPTAPYLAFDADGTLLGSVTVNQQGSGAQWVTLGSWPFTAGWNRVILSRWTGVGDVVIADAVRVQ